MRIVVQRVSSAAVAINETQVAAIERGLLVLAAFTHSDTEETVSWAGRKLPSLRIFEDDDGKLNRSVEEIGGEILVVSQFTLYGDCRKGKRPSFDMSAPPDRAEALYDLLLLKLGEHTNCRIASGVFREYMQVSLVNDGPVTLVIEKE